ncbi:MAG: hypothetical protein HWE39_05700 [Oceanospirillaceae bacterium]|nr:hypothetical protein [Oceanospirillaceae bacterium]
MRKLWIDKALNGMYSASPDYPIRPSHTCLGGRVNDSIKVKLIKCQPQKYIGNISTISLPFGLLKDNRPNVTYEQSTFKYKEMLITPLSFALTNIDFLSTDQHS